MRRGWFGKVNFSTRLGAFVRHSRGSAGVDGVGSGVVDRLAGGGGRGVGDGTGVIHVGDVASDFRLAVSALLVGGGRIGVDSMGACGWFVLRLLLRLTGISC